MITRGYIIGKIVDDLAGLKYQVETRNKLQIFDLTRFSEDFFKELLNILFDLNLDNLNNERTNSPGIDLGDKNEGGVAYQITSTKTSQKIDATLLALTNEQAQAYKSIKVLIIGEKQNSYSINSKRAKKLNFSVKENIVDINDLLRDIMVLDTGKLDSLLNLFNREFRQLKIEFEPVDTLGNYESSIYNMIEEIPNKKPFNANKLSAKFDEDFNLKSILKLYKDLSLVPRVTRELLALIAERGKRRLYTGSSHEWGILPKNLENWLRMTELELYRELIILQDADLIYFSDEYLNDRPLIYVALNGETINGVINWAKKSDVSLKRLFNTMDFTILDE